MDTTKTIQCLQIEFFLLHGLAAELGLLGRMGRGTPATAVNVKGGLNILNRLMRSCLVKVFPHPFSVSKCPYKQEFEISIGAETRIMLIRAKDQDPCRTLQVGTPSEIGIIRFNFPHSLIVTMGGSRIRYNQWSTDFRSKHLGIGKYCLALRAALGWKNRFESVVAAISDSPDLEGPQRNLAQERLDALFANRRA